ncbi:hypothetical protein AOC36_01900 [Erysipelothrix larvae]|uniref:YbbR-like protein n=1 Tax=Erysipelothrix larvae TaxID=1514105 RepID=A0A0X8GYI4_9FIRM|nr:CdaR family protein [Erysipelothrix larvae]AMC92779.1 hypothetical protein AOC36_01900 [Erysipelothrix larvae]
MSEKHKGSKGHPTNEKTEIAQRIAKQSARFARRYEAVTDFVSRIFRWFSAWFDRIIFNQKYSKLVAFVVAILVVMAFTNNPVEPLFQTKTLTRVKVNAIYNSEMYEVEGIPEYVEVNIIGDYSDVISVNANDITVDLDLGKLTEGQHQVDFVPVGVSQRVRATVTPSSARVTIRLKETKTMELSYDFINLDKLGNQFVLGEVTLDNRDVTISASRETLDTIAFVKALIDVSGKTETFTQEANVVAYDQNGNRVENADVIPRVVNATVEVSSPSKTVPIYVSIEGAIPNNKAVASITQDHNAITIYGPLSVLDTIDEIVISVPASTLTQGRMTHNITLPTGVRYGNVSKVNLDVKLGDAVTQTFDNIPITYRENVNGFKIRATNEDDFTTSITVTGTAENIASFNRDNIAVFINMRNIQEGNNQEVQLYVDSNFTLLNIVSTKQTIIIDVIK